MNHYDYMPEGESCCRLTTKNEPCQVRKGRQLDDGTWVCHVHDPQGNYQINSKHGIKRTEVQKLKQENRKLRELIHLLTSSDCSLRLGAEQSLRSIDDEAVPDVEGQITFKELIDAQVDDDNATALFSPPDDTQLKKASTRIKKWTAP